MDLAEARADLARALATEPADARVRLAREILIRRGAECLGLERAAVGGLGGVLDRLARAVATPPRRAFAVLIVHGLAVEGLVADGPAQARDVCTLLESALPEVLRRSGYPFSGDADARRHFLAHLHETIDDCLRPLEPTFPRWLNGLEADREA